MTKAQIEQQIEKNNEDLRAARANGWHSLIGTLERRAARLAEMA